MLLFLAQSLFERERVRLIHFVRDIFPNPGAALVQFKRRIFLWHLLHANQNLQREFLARSNLVWQTKQYRRGIEDLGGTPGGVSVPNYAASSRSKCYYGLVESGSVSRLRAPCGRALELFSPQRSVPKTTTATAAIINWRPMA